ncbi:hypothetical protein AeNC1_017112, partial [Aphanomyces euteiches]
MRVWILLALAMSAVVAYSQQNRDEAVADKVSPMDSGLHNLRRLKWKTVKDALKPLTLSARASAKAREKNKENPKRGNMYQDDKKMMEKAITRSGGFYKNMDIHDFDRVRRGQAPKRTYLYSFQSGKDKS